MANVDYFSSERFIHDDLAERAELIAEEAQSNWQKTQNVEPFAVTWPAAAVRSDDGKNIDHAVLCRMPASFSKAQCLETLHDMVVRTKAYGLVIVLPAADSIQVLFETQHGARAWLIPLERHGDVLVCLPAVVHDNAECAGLLWKPAHTRQD